MPESLIEQITATNPRSVAYFPCNPKTLVRDLAIFRQNGYAATDIFPFDMFPKPITWVFDGFAAKQMGHV
ncbi:MAG: hypothetical protein R3C26_19210 [Calditrichia bacterium]